MNELVPPISSWEAPYFKTQEELATQIIALRTALRALVEAVQDKDNPSDEGLSSDADEMIVARQLLGLPDKWSRR